MGAKRKVDKKLYTTIKKELKTPKDDVKVMKKYNLGQTTVRAIRRTSSYVMFLSRTRKSNKSLSTPLSLPVRRRRNTLAEMFVIGFVWLAVLAMGLSFIFFTIWLVVKIIGG